MFCKMETSVSVVCVNEKADTIVVCSSVQLYVFRHNFVVLRIREPALMARGIVNSSIVTNPIFIFI